MAHPKRRQSKTRTLKRRTHDKAVAPTLAVCPNNSRQGSSSHIGSLPQLRCIPHLSHRMPHLRLLSRQDCYRNGRSC